MSAFRCSEWGTKYDESNPCGANCSCMRALRSERASGQRKNTTFDGQEINADLILGIYEHRNTNGLLAIIALLLLERRAR
jgi:hypothetical protein